MKTMSDSKIENSVRGRFKVSYRMNQQAQIAFEDFVNSEGLRGFDDVKALMEKDSEAFRAKVDECFYVIIKAAADVYFNEREGVRDD